MKIALRLCVAVSLKNEKKCSKSSIKKGKDEWICGKKWDRIKLKLHFIK